MLPDFGLLFAYPKTGTHAITLFVAAGSQSCHHLARGMEHSRITAGQWNRLKSCQAPRPAWSNVKKLGSPYGAVGAEARAVEGET